MATKKELEKALRVVLESVEVLLKVFPKGTENFRGTEELIEYIKKVLEDE